MKQAKQLGLVVILTAIASLFLIRVKVVKRNFNLKLKEEKRSFFDGGGGKADDDEIFFGYVHRYLEARDRGLTLEQITESVFKVSRKLSEKNRHMQQQS